MLYSPQYEVMHVILYHGNAWVTFNYMTDRCGCRGHFWFFFQLNSCRQHFFQYIYNSLTCDLTLKNIISRNRFVCQAILFCHFENLGEFLQIWVGLFAYKQLKFWNFFSQLGKSTIIHIKYLTSFTILVSHRWMGEWLLPASLSLPFPCQASLSYNGLPCSRPRVGVTKPSSSILLFSKHFQLWKQWMPVKYECFWKV